MTDRELLELAARAGGIVGTYREPVGANPYGIEVCDEQGVCYDWNPLTDPGDALRLAVHLELVVDMRCKVDVWPVHVGADNHEWVSERANGNPLAATMRAITRAAAEIGKGIKQ